MNYLTLTALLLTLSSTVSFAGKAEREEQKRIEAALKKSGELFEKACGCNVKFEVMWNTYSSVDVMNRIEMAGEKLAENAPAFCSDAESKKAICKLKIMNLSYAAEPKEPQFTNGKLQGETNDMRTLDWPEYIKLLDK